MRRRDPHDAMFEVIIVDIANASTTEAASLTFCYIGVGNTTDAQTVSLDETTN